MDVVWHHPFTCCISGPSGCGKTVFVERLLKHYKEMISPTPRRIVWSYGVDQPDLRGRLERGGGVRGVKL